MGFRKFAEAVKIIGDSLHSCELLREKIKTTLNQDAPVAIAKGNATKGVNAELDELRAISTSGKEFLEGIEKRVTTD
jgi:DNA mismatch repair protein MutS